MDFSGFFAIEAGDTLTPLVLLNTIPRSGTIPDCVSITGQSPELHVGMSDTCCYA